MNKILVVGSTVVDVLIEIETLPTSGSDMQAKSQQMMMGGCAYNVHKTLDYLKIPHTLFSPVGTGVYGKVVRAALRDQDHAVLLNSEEENGCCYCFVEANGERSFISHHGAEYLFKKEWFNQLDVREYNRVYLCGLELEETSGAVIVDFLCEHPELEIYFAPGPRVQYIEATLMDRLLSCNVVLHLNSDELMALTKENNIDQALKVLHNRTQRPIIVTRGEQGSSVIENHVITNVKAVPTVVANTNGAGDSHMGAVLAGLYLNKKWKEILREANEIAAGVVSSKLSYIE